MPSPGGSSQPGDEPRSPALAGGFFFFFYHLTTREALTGSQMATFAAASFFPPLGHHEARGLLSTSASIEPVTPALESGILTIGPPGKPYEGPLLAMSTRGSSWGTMWLSCVQLFETPWTVAHQALLFMGFPRQEYWSRLPFPSPGYLPNLGTEPVSPALAGGFFTTEPPEKPG